MTSCFFSLLKVKRNFYLTDVLAGEALGIILIGKAYYLIESISMCKGNEQNGYMSNPKCHKSIAC